LALIRARGPDRNFMKPIKNDDTNQFAVLCGAKDRMVLSPARCRILCSVPGRLVVPMAPWLVEARDSLRHFWQGAAAGVLVTMVAGFAGGGWAPGSTVERIPRAGDVSAIVATQAPICVN
jgi:hypothetical protein